MGIRIIHLMLIIALCTDLGIFSPAYATPQAMVFSGSNVLTNSMETIDPSKASKATVLVFLSSTCPCSQSHLNHLNDLKNEFPQFEFFGVLSNSDENPEIAKGVFSSTRFPVIYDADMKIADNFKALKTPHVFVIDKNAQILFQGGVTDASNALKATRFYLKQALTAINKNETFEPKVARALGCYIRRK